jgi:hypothetical protein
MADSPVWGSLTEMRALGFDVDGVEGLAGDHEEAVSFFAAEAEVGANYDEN